MSPAPALKHQIISKEIFLILNDFVRKNHLGEVFYAPCDVVLSNINVMQPDILFISNNNFQILTELNIKGAPDLIVEIISQSTRDTDRIYKKMSTKNLVLKSIGSSIQMKKLSKSGF